MENLGEKQNHKQEAGLRMVAQLLTDILPEIYNVEMGFVLLVWPSDSDEDGIADYIGNARREDVINLMRETADRLEQNQDIPATQGNA